MALCSALCGPEGLGRLVMISRRTLRAPSSPHEAPHRPTFPAFSNPLQHGRQPVEPRPCSYPGRPSKDSLTTPHRATQDGEHGPQKAQGPPLSDPYPRLQQGRLPPPGSPCWSQAHLRARLRGDERRDEGKGGRGLSVGCAVRPQQLNHGCISPAGRFTHCVCRVAAVSSCCCCCCCGSVGGVESSAHHNLPCPPLFVAQAFLSKLVEDTVTYTTHRRAVSVTAVTMHSSCWKVVVGDVLTCGRVCAVLAFVCVVRFVPR